MIKSRENWIDQARGFAMFLVVYGHNFPITEKYIYSFHMPLFLIISGFFVPAHISGKYLKKRFRTIIIPYFLWGFFLYFFWFLIGNRYGNSADLNLSPFKNFLGVFYGQGGQEMMDWGIPMWFLPNIFLVFVLLAFAVNFFGKYYRWIVAAISFGGFLFSNHSDIPLFWSLNVACVSLFFVALGKDLFKVIQSRTKTESVVLAVLFLGLNLLLFPYNDKVDMYRSIYGQSIPFLLNSVLGSLGFIFLFKSFPVFKFFEPVGKMTILILALQLLAMTVIKFVLLYVFGISDFNFSEVEKFFYAVVQVLLIVPAGFLINKFIPLLNGGFKKI